MALEQRTEERLIELARSGERPALQELWQAHRRWVAAIVLAHRPRAIEVDDLMQEVAVRLVSRLGTLRDAKAFRPWLRQIVINVCRGAARNHRGSLHFNGPEQSSDGGIGMTSSPVGGGDPADVLVARDDAARRLLDQALTLPPEYREPLLLRCVRSLSYKEMSEILGVPVTTIETRLARARRMLRSEIGEAIT